MKYATYRLHLKYFDNCLELNLIPEFLKFRPPNLEAYNNNTNKFYVQAVKEQRKITAQKLRETKHRYSELVTTMTSRLSVMNFRLLFVCVQQQVVNKIIEEKKRKHDTKLYNLWKKQCPPVPDCIVNLSDRKLSLLEHNALLYGLNHHILPQRIDPIAVKADIDGQVRRICKNNDIHLTYDKKNGIREATDRFVHEAESLCKSEKNRNLHKTLRHLSKDNTVKVCRMDKGVGVVIMNDSDYYDKLDCIINDNSRFRLLKYNINTESVKDCANAPWIQKAKSVSYYCQNYIEPLVDDATYYRLLPTGSQPGKLYGMAKNHKPGCPMRPVLSAINTPEYNLARWLERQIKPLMDCKYAVTSSAAFIAELRQLNPRSTDLCVSFDIKSLFTNVPLKEVIEDITHKVFPKNATPLLFQKSEQPKGKKKKKKKKKKEKKITRTVLKNMLTVCSESIFLYRNGVYQQHDGVAMGSPLAPLLAEWFVSKIENNILQRDYPCKPTFYRRYVDDVFALFKCEDDVKNFFALLNEAHPNLKFTIETSTTFLPFLDTAISIKSNQFESWVYRKPTNTGVILNYHAVAPRRWKKSLVTTMLMRAFRVSSSLTYFQSELDAIRKIFKENLYPSHMIETIITSFITSHEVTEESFKTTTPCSVLPKKSDDKKEVYLCVPFVGKPSTKFQRRMEYHLQGPNLRLKTAFRTTKVSEHFSLKSRCSWLFSSNVVYRFTCSNDSSITYIGETTRQLFERIIDHRGRDKNSAVLDHLYNCSQCQDTGNIANLFEVIQRCSSSTIASTEALLISRHCPSLNTQMGPGQGKIVSLVLY